MSSCSLGSRRRTGPVLAALAWMQAENSSPVIMISPDQYGDPSFLSPHGRFDPQRDGERPARAQRCRCDGDNAAHTD